MEPEEITLQMINPIFHSVLLSASVALCVGNTALPLSVSWYSMCVCVCVFKQEFQVMLWKLR